MNLVKYTIIIFTVLFNFNAYASELPESEAQSLANTYKPILELHEDESYAPINVKSIASNPDASPPAVLHREGYKDVIITESVLDYLVLLPGITTDSFIDLPPEAYAGMEKNYTVYYRVFYNPDRVYPYAIQYWFFYYRNPWGIILHEGDWESTTIFLDSKKQPQEAALSTHYEAHRYSWSALNVTGNRLHIYIAKGGHGSYAYSGETYYEKFPDWPDWPDAISLPGWPGQYDHHEGGTQIDDYELVDLKESEGTDNWLNFEGAFGDPGNGYKITNILPGPPSPLVRTDAPSTKAWNDAINPPRDPCDECSKRTGTKLYGSYKQDDGDLYGPWRWAQGYPLQSDLLSDGACQAVPSSQPTNLITTPVDTDNQIIFSWEDSEWDSVNWYLIIINNDDSTEVERLWLPIADITCTGNTCTYTYDFEASEGTYSWTVMGANNGGNGQKSDADTFVYGENATVLEPYALTTYENENSIAVTPGGTVHVHGILEDTEGSIIDEGQLNLVHDGETAYTGHITHGRVYMRINAPDSTTTYEVKATFEGKTETLSKLKIAIDDDANAVTKLRSTIGAGTVGITFTRPSGYSRAKVSIGSTEIYDGTSTSASTSNYDPGTIVTFRVYPYYIDSNDNRQYGEPRYVTERVGWGGTLSGDAEMKWSAQQALPHRIVSDLTVPKDTTLTIVSGVTIYVSSWRDLTINGGLIAKATGESDRIVFTSAQTTPAAGDWNYIQFNADSTGSLKYVTVEYAGGNTTAGALIIESSPTINHLLLRYVEHTHYSHYTANGIFIHNSAAPIIANSVIKDVQNYGISATSSGDYQIIGNDIEGEKGAVYVSYNKNDPLIEDNTYTGTGNNNALNVAGTIVSDSTWDADVNIKGDVTVASDATLTINPGVTIYVSSWRDLTINGGLIAKATGESDRIVFTSAQTTPAAGDWNYIQFNADSTGSLKYVTVEYAGGNTTAGALIIESSPTINHLLLRYVEHTHYSHYTANGIFIHNSAAPIIANSVIKDVQNYGISATSSGDYQIIGNDIEGEKGAVYVSYNKNDPLIEDNTYTGTGNNNALNVAGTIVSDSTWDADVNIKGDVTVASDATLTINPGVTIYVSSWRDLTINGGLIAKATGESDRIVFTSAQTTPAAGDWNYIQFNADSTGSLKYVTVEYAGGNTTAGALIIESSPTINHLLLRYVEHTHYSHYTANGIFIHNSAAPIIANSVIKDVVNGRDKLSQKWSFKIEPPIVVENA